MRPIIGITPDTDAGKKIKTRSPKERVVYLWDRYLQAVLDHGALAVVLPVTDEAAQVRALAERLDGFILAGGHFDVPPEFYGEKPRSWLGPLKPERSRFELALFREALGRGKPVLGICGGMQLINVALGGTLFQDILRERLQSRDHEQESKKTSTSHSVAIARGSRLAGILRAPGNRIRVNSSHHQAVKDLGRGLAAAAFAPDGLIEAVELPDAPFVIGVQWHPELLYGHHPDQARLLRALVRAARNRV